MQHEYRLKIWKHALWIVRPNSKYAARANLDGANLDGRIIQIGTIGSRQSYTVYIIKTDAVQCGCFRGTLDDFEKVMCEKYPDGKYRKEYDAAIAMFRAMKDA